MCVAECRFVGSVLLFAGPSPQGRGIQLTRTLEDIPDDGTMLVQEYLPKPFLIDGYKFDLRLYVLVTSYEPLRVFLCVPHCQSVHVACSHAHTVYRPIPGWIA